MPTPTEPALVCRDLAHPVSIALTGHSIREAEAAPVDRMRMMRRVWRGRR
jgi:hypothetical protein